jgi:hypothetical protein
MAQWRQQVGALQAQLANLLEQDEQLNFHGHHGGRGSSSSSSGNQ